MADKLFIVSVFNDTEMARKQCNYLNHYANINVIELPACYCKMQLNSLCVDKYGEGRVCVDKYGDGRVCVDEYGEGSVCVDNYGEGRVCVDEYGEGRVCVVENAERECVQTNEKQQQDAALLQGNPSEPPDDCVSSQL